MKNYLLLCFLLLSFAAHAGKDGHTVTGRVVDAKQQPLLAANVVLLTDGKTLVKSDLTTETGSFSLEGIAPGTYTLKVTLSGYEIHSSETILVSGNTELPAITLLEKSGTLTEVAVRAQKPFIEIRSDKIIVNVENSIVSAGSSAMEVLQRSPGVTVNQNDNISLKGKSGVMIWIDGKQTPMAGADLANVLKSMPAGSIDRIEIISNPGARYDAAGTAGIINIKTKKDQRMGTNGSVNLSYGQGVYPKYAGGASLNYRKGKVNVFGNYNISRRYWFNHLMLNRKFLDTLKESPQKHLFRYDQDNYAIFDFTNNMLSGGLDYTHSKNTTFGFSANGGTNRFNPKADNNSRALGASDELLYNFYTTGRHENLYYNYAVNGYMRHSFDTSGRELNVDLDYASFGNQSKQNFLTTYESFDATSRPNYYLNSDLNGVTRIRSVKADYV
ncbi:MAG: TonB-dependent receptor, partial [Sphingobacteriales bacterium]